MKRSLQEYVELVVFGLIALLVGTGLLWVLGWVLSLGGIVLKGLAGLLWMLLRFIVPVAIAGGLVYFLVKAAQDKQKPTTATSGSGSSGTRGAVIDVPPAGGAGPTVQHAAAAVGEAAATTAEAVADVAVEVGDTVAETVEDIGRSVGSATEEARATVADIAAEAAADVEGMLAGEDDEDEPTA